ncbi:MAG TPA: helix-turn-helix domain-containing protein [bacterium]|nr:helix-turn-helix domain-containing protein [bacterium]
MTTATAPITPFAFSIADAARYSALSRSRLYQLINEGVIAPAHVGGRVLILRDDLERFLLSHRASN